jgi:hypothetical protein
MWGLILTRMHCIFPVRPRRHESGTRRLENRRVSLYILIQRGKQVSKKARKQPARKQPARKQPARKQPARKQPTRGLIALGIGGLLIIAAVLYFALPNGTPELAVDREKIDFGFVKHNTRKTFALNVTNIGDGVLKFKKQPYIEVLEGC